MALEAKTGANTENVHARRLGQKRAKTLGVREKATIPHVSHASLDFRMEVSRSSNAQDIIFDSVLHRLYSGLVKSSQEAWRTEHQPEHMLPGSFGCLECMGLKMQNIFFSICFY